jgi:hypothetical protein
MFFVSDSFIENLNAQIPSFLLAILIKLLTSKFILQKAQIYYAPVWDYLHQKLSWKFYQVYEAVQEAMR